MGHVFTRGDPLRRVADKEAFKAGVKVRHDDLTE